jgi:hypothetical protein
MTSDLFAWIFLGVLSVSLIVLLLLHAEWKSRVSYRERLNRYHEDTMESFAKYRRDLEWLKMAVDQEKQRDHDDTPNGG